MIDAATAGSLPKRNGRFNSIMPGAVSLPKPPLHPATGHPSVLEHRTPLVSLQCLFAPRTSDRALVHAAMSRVPFCRLQLGTVGFPDVCMLLITTLATHVSQYQGHLQQKCFGLEGPGGWKVGGPPPTGVLGAQGYWSVFLRISLGHL